MSTEQPGPVVLFGSGETSASGQRVFDLLFRRLSAPIRVAVLETPAGFELNSAQVAGRVAEFLQHRLQNYHPQVEIVPARKRGTPFSPDDPNILAPLLHADAIFLGPGSPTYAARQLRGSLAWHTLTAHHRLGATVVLASAAAVAAGAHALPVYEIYKVGQDLHWSEGLDLFGAYGLNLAFVPHWNNTDGGAELDTSHCYMGLARFCPLHNMLPTDVTVVGIDEHTALVVDLASESCQVQGKGGVTVLQHGEEKRFDTQASFPICELGPYERPIPKTGLPTEVWQRAKAARRQARSKTEPCPSSEVLTLVRERTAARKKRDWAKADILREQIADLGWSVLDTPNGTILESMTDKT